VTVFGDGSSGASVQDPAAVTCPTSRLSALKTERKHLYRELALQAVCAFRAAFRDSIEPSRVGFSRTGCTSSAARRGSKTTFCAQFITQGAKKGEDCLYVTMHETQTELMQDMSGYEFGFDRAMQSDAIQFLNLVTESGKRTISQFGTESGLTNRLIAFIEQNGVDRVVVDSTMLLQHFLTDVSQEITGFLSALKQTDATILLISEMTDPSSYSDEHYLAHGVIFFHNFLDRGSMTRECRRSRCAAPPSTATSAR